MSNRSPFLLRITLVPLLCLLTAAPCLHAQSDQKAQSPDAGIVGDNDEPDVPAIVSAKATPAEALASAWKNLDEAAANTKAQIRVDVLAAIGTLGANTRAENTIRSLLSDKDRDVRLAAVVAASASENHALIPDLRKALGDPAPEVAYAAAASLWHLHDYTGQNVLYDVLDGERKANSSFWNQQMHTADKDIHSPSTLAAIGAEQGAYAAAGPFGIGVTAARMMIKGPQPNSARVLSATMLAEDHSDLTRQKLIAALGDKDYYVRGASARALGNFTGKDVNDALLNAFEDRKPSVRLMASAAYIRVSTPAPSTSSPKRRRRAPKG